MAAASYEARAYGVRSAMPAAQARRLCPQAIFVAGQYDRYTEVSRDIHEIFQAYTPLVEGIALDEAFFDVSGATGLFGEGAAIAQRIREQIQSELGLTASVGVAATKFVAKLASEAAKPRASLSGVVPGAGVVVVAPGAELAFLHPKPVEALWGVGPVTATRLQALGVSTIGQLAAIPVDTLERSVGAANGRHLHELASGRDPRRVEPDRAVQSVGHEETYPWDRDDRADLERELVRMADSVATRLRAGGVTRPDRDPQGPVRGLQHHHPVSDPARSASTPVPRSPGLRPTCWPRSTLLSVSGCSACRSPTWPRGHLSSWRWRW